MSVNLVTSTSINLPITSFQAQVNVKYSSAEQKVAIFFYEQHFHISVTTLPCTGCYRFLVREEKETQERHVFVKLRYLAKMLQVKRVYLSTALTIKKISRFEELVQLQMQVERLSIKWNTTQKVIWHDLSHLLKAKKLFEADYTFLPNTGRSLLNKKLRFFIRPYMIKGDNGKVKFINTSGKLLDIGGNRIIYTCENIANGKTLVNATGRESDVDLSTTRKEMRYEHSVLKYLKEKGVKGIISWVFASEDTNRRPVEILMSLYQGSLNSMIGILSEEERGALFMQVLETIKDMHALRVVHRDIKPENILITKNKGLKFKLTDFGAACLLKDQEQVEKFPGTKYYASPEFFRSYLRKEIPDWLKHDMWGVGILLYCLHYGCHPLKPQEKALWKAQKKERYEELAGFMESITIPEPSDDESQIVHEALRNLLNPNTLQRWSADKTFSYMKEQLKGKTLRIGKESLSKTPIFIDSEPTIILDVLPKVHISEPTNLAVNG